MKIIKSVFVLSSILIMSQGIAVNAQSSNEVPVNTPSINAPSINNCFDQAKLSNNPMEELTALGRALNLARQTGEATNGGLKKYRAEASMFGPMDEVNCVVNDDNTWTFTFQGTTPYSNVPIVETAVKINHQTWDIVVDRNTSLN
jgi:hypothetical protein